ncbi:MULTISPECIES: DUF3137 domain-containing protein [unclassified Campylobacter]|uniref:DUF3137 domain-containing protein n=1 Tax=unclassified Campylobacter TaxID=2593542 RepID=UPI0022E9E0FC|nr:MULTISPECIES: DUF3137 domain-containing protein [unclassified Campylobacter]MDA3085518.1 DUF3137 domain-containing protein [Campylobacter sp. CS_ED1]MDA3090433.1 DUF3137 domain-containing protein [Campylobacter sp. CS_ED2]
MDISELENLRFGILKEVDKAKPLAILGAFILPILIWLILHLKDYNLDKRIIVCVCIIIISPMLIFIAQNSDDSEPDEIKFIKFIFVILIAFTLYQRDFFYIAVFIFTPITIFLTYKIIIKHIKEAKQKIYQKEFKIHFLEPYVAEFGFSYKSSALVEIADLENSKLFWKKIYLLEEYARSGNDKICGNFDNIKFEFYDLTIYDKNRNHGIYGIFFHANFNKNINSTTFVVSKETVCDNAKKFKKITMDDSEFNSKFSVYSNDLQNAMYILSPAFMKRLLDLKRRLNFPISVSFVGDKIYIFLDTGKDNFEPDIDKSVLHANPAFTIKRELSHFLSIVKTLNLNTKIWKV